MARAQTDIQLVAEYLDHVILHPDPLVLRLTNDRDPITMPWSHEPARRRRDIVVPPGCAGESLRPIKVEDRARILKAIATGRAWMDELV